MMSQYQITTHDGIHTVLVTHDGVEWHDLNAEGEPCRTFDELRDFVRELHEQGAFDAETRDELLDEWPQPLTLTPEPGEDPGSSDVPRLASQLYAVAFALKADPGLCGGPSAAAFGAATVLLGYQYGFTACNEIHKHVLETGDHSEANIRLLSLGSGVDPDLGW